MWRNTGQPVRLLMLDARACLPILSVMVYWSWPTLYIAIIGVAFFSAISFFGLTLPAMIAACPSLARRPGSDRRAGLEPTEVGVSEVSVDAVGRTMQALLAFDRRPIRYHDGATGRDITIDAETPRRRQASFRPLSSPARRSGATRPGRDLRSTSCGIRRRCSATVSARSVPAISRPSCWRRWRRSTRSPVPRRSCSTIWRAVVGRQ